MPPKSIAEYFQLDVMLPFTPRYNVAPTQSVPAISPGGDGVGRVGAVVRWGLLPSWTKEPKSSALLINARAETIHEKPSFRTPFARKRCLIPALGFYEWKHSGRGKRPYFFRLLSDEPMAFAGIRDEWRRGNTVLESCAILTVGANDLMKPVHNRMPVIVKPTDFDRWLDTTITGRAPLESILVPYGADEMTAYPVSDRVNKASADDPGLIEPL